jgi:broad specificity phosphatase PhoE
VWRFLGIAVTSFALLIGAAIPAAAAELMRVTFVRHGESTGNASGLIDTSTPGPVLTPLGQQQAQNVVGTLGDNNYDAIYASTMVRTQLTAAPMSQYLGLPIQVLPGLQEIEAGVFEGTPESQGGQGYALPMLAWTFQGNRDVRIPGSIDGHEFDARVDGALKTMYDKGDRNPVVYSHGGTTMFWTMMNVQNLTLQQKIQLLSTSQLHNTDYVVIEGNPEDGWTLVNWNGKQFSPEPTLFAEVKLQVRTLTRQLATAAGQVAEAFATRDLATIATAINRSLADAIHSIVKFQRAVTAKVIHEVDQAIRPPAPAPVPAPSNALAVASSAEPAESAAPLKAGTDPTPTAARKSSSVAEPEVTEKDATSNGATDLTDGNKAVPGTPATSSDDAGEGVQDTATDVEVTTPADELAEATKPADPADSDTSDATGGVDGSDSQQDAA